MPKRKSEKKKPNTEPNEKYQKGKTENERKKEETNEKKKTLTTESKLRRYMGKKHRNEEPTIVVAVVVVVVVVTIKAYTWRKRRAHDIKHKQRAHIKHASSENK